MTKIFISLSKRIEIWRIEHRESKLGPYEHGGQIDEVLRKGIKNTTSSMSDIDAQPEVQRLLKKYPQAKFGFVSKERCLSVVRDTAVLKKHGFVVRKYTVEPLFVSEDGQVLFNQ